MSAPSSSRMHSLIQDAAKEDAFSRFRSDSVRETAAQCLNTMRSLAPMSMPSWTDEVDNLAVTQKSRPRIHLPG